MEQYLSPLEIAFIVDLFLAIVLGFVIGAERESRGKDAGISTHTFGFGFHLIAGLASIFIPRIPQLPSRKRKLFGGVQQGNEYNSDKFVASDD